MRQGDIEKRMARLHGQSKATREYVQKELGSRDWWTRCWNCGNRVEGTPAALAGSCPHCGAHLSKKNG